MMQSNRLENFLRNTLNDLGGIKLPKYTNQRRHHFFWTFEIPKFSSIADVTYTLVGLKVMASNLQFRGSGSDHKIL